MPYSIYTFEQKKIFAKRIKLLRKQKRLTQLALAEALTESEENTERLVITCPNVASWERMHVAKPATLSLIARFFGVTEAFLVGNEQPEEIKASYSANNEALKVIQNVKELSLHNGEPIYVRRNDKYSFGRWMLVDTLHARLISVGIADMDFGDLDPDRYTFFTRDPFRSEMISNPDVAKNQELVYIMPYGSYDGIKELYTGWYSFDEEHAMFVKKGNGTIGLDLKDYGVTYIAFPGVPDILNEYL